MHGDEKQNQVRQYGDGGTGHYTTLPEPISLEETVAEHPTNRWEPPAGGDASESE